MPIIHQRPDNDVVSKNYHLLEKLYPRGFSLSGLPLTSWEFRIGKGGIVVATVTVDLEQIWLLDAPEVVPDWAMELSKKIEKEIKTTVHIYTS